MDASFTATSFVSKRKISMDVNADTLFTGKTKIILEIYLVISSKNVILLTNVNALSLICYMKYYFMTGIKIYTSFW